MTIYLPNTNYSCYYMPNDYTIRAYHTTPRQNSSSDYTDYFINSHYINRSGTQTFSQYTTLPTCMTDTFTTNVFYRNDIADIMITFFILLIICFYFPYRIITRAFGRWLKW